MARTIIFAGLVLGLTAGCDRLQESQLNPGNWLNGRTAGPAQPEVIDPLVPERRVVRTIDDRPLVAQLTALEVTPTSGGALIRATGLAAQSGTYNAQLVLRGRSGGTASYEMRVFDGDGGGGRTISVAEFLTNAELAGITRIEVRSASNTLSRSAR